MNIDKTMISGYLRLRPTLIILGILALSGAFPLLVIPGGGSLLIYGLVLRRQAEDRGEQALAALAIALGALMVFLSIVFVLVFTIRPGRDETEIIVGLGKSFLS